MPSRTDRTDGEIDWPDFAERTEPRRRERTSKFSVTLAQALNDIEAELEDRLNVTDWRLSTAAPHRKKDGRPYADANPDDPGVVVRWSNDGEQYCVAADHYTDLRDNARAIGLYITEKRKMGNRPVKTGQDEFATARLPPGDDSKQVVVAGTGEVEAPHEALDVDPSAPDEVVKAAFRAKSKQVHPDQGGSRAEWQRLQNAREAMLDE